MTRDSDCVATQDVPQRIAFFNPELLKSTTLSGQEALRNLIERLELDISYES